MNLLSRYIFRETAGSTAIVLAVLLIIFMSNQFAEILGEAAANEIPKSSLFVVFGLTFLNYLTLLAPFALLLGIMLALARLNRDSETAALSACGVGPGRLMRPIMLLTLPSAVAVTWLSLVQAPAANRRIADITEQARAEFDLSAIEAGKFTSPDGGDTILYPAEVVDGELHGVFMQREQDGRLVVVVAERGEQVLDPDTGGLSVVLFDGWRYDGVPGDADVSIAEFGEHGFPIRRASDREIKQSLATVSSATLLRSEAVEDQAELQWRLSAPLSLLVLALLAVPLSRSAPREGRYGRIGVALLIYLCYANSLSLARVWMERELVPAWLGVWWVHVFVGCCAMLMLARYAGWLSAVRPVEASRGATA